MTVAFSTSSPVASVALFDAEYRLLWQGSEHAPQAASGACLALLEKALSEVRAGIGDARFFLADLGPGSFTGTRVGVTLAKTLAFSIRVPAAGAQSFDLIDPAGTVVLPSRRGEWFIREPGQAPSRSAELPGGKFSGYGPGIEAPSYPDASRFVALSVAPASPELLIPSYRAEPSISLPKRAYGLGEHAR